MSTVAVHVVRSADGVKSMTGSSGLTGDSNSTDVRVEPFGAVAETAGFTASSTV